LPAEKAFAVLVLEDGRSFVGVPLGADALGQGEVVFNTAMTGYQEVLTDPSYAGQMVCMTYPLQGNYGVRDADAESARPWAGLPSAQPSFERGVARRVPATVERSRDHGDRHPCSHAPYPNQWSAAGGAGP